MVEHGTISVVRTCHTGSHTDALPSELNISLSMVEDGTISAVNALQKYLLSRVAW